MGRERARGRFSAFRQRVCLLLHVVGLEGIKPYLVHRQGARNQQIQRVKLRALRSPENSLRLHRNRSVRFFEIRLQKIGSIAIEL